MKLEQATLLIVEDEPDLRGFFRRWFEREGARVLTAENGAAGLDIAAATHVDLVISDIRMPVMDGIEMARQLKRAKAYVPKMVFVTGFTDLSTRELYDLGVEAALYKPIGRRELVEIARRCIADAEERWCVAAEQTPRSLVAAELDSLGAAVGDGRIALGRGGFCLRIHTAAREGEPVRIAIGFARDGRSLRGEGVLRWSATNTEQIGVEITYVDDSCRSWLAGVTSAAGITSFIPAASLPVAPAVVMLA